MLPLKNANMAFIQDITLEEMNRFLMNAPGTAKRQGRTLKAGTLQIIRAVMSNVIQYAFADNSGGTVIDRDFTSYETLLPEEIETICLGKFAGGLLGEQKN